VSAVTRLPQNLVRALELAILALLALEFRQPLPLVGRQAPTLIAPVLPHPAAQRLAVQPPTSTFTRSASC
jgi:hypothetical protein